MWWVLELAYPQHRSVEEWEELLALCLELHLSVLLLVQVSAQALAQAKGRHLDPLMAFARTG